MSELSERILTPAIEKATEVYEEKQCWGSGCCGDIDGAIRTAVGAALRGLADPTFGELYVRVTGSAFLNKRVLLLLANEIGGTK